MNRVNSGSGFSYDDSTINIVVGIIIIIIIINYSLAMGQIGAYVVLQNVCLVL